MVGYATGWRATLTLVDIGGIGLLSGLGALLLVAGVGCLLAGFLLLCGSFASGCLAGGGGGLLVGGGLGRHGERFMWVVWRW